MDTRAVRRDATRDRILQAAWQLVARDGLGAISLRDVAQLVGMRAPSLYTYFPSKNAMYDAMYADSVGLLAEAVGRRQEHPDPRERLRDRMRRFIAFCVSHPERYQLIMERPVPGFEPTAESFESAMTALAGTRADLEAVGVVGEPALDMWRALMHGMISEQIANEPGGDRWTRLQDDAFEMFLTHYAKASSRKRSPKREG